MMKHARILVPTDFSEASEEALRRACHMAEAFDAELLVVHVVEMIMPVDIESMPMMVDEEIQSELHDSSEHQLQQLVEKIQQQTKARVKGEVVDAMGNTAGTICDLAKEGDFDLIVIGRQGKQGFLEHLLMGSTAEKVIRHAPCSVLIAMPHKLFAG